MVCGPSSMSAAATPTCMHREGASSTTRQWVGSVVAAAGIACSEPGLSDADSEVARVRQVYHEQMAVMRLRDACECRQHFLDGCR